MSEMSVHISIYQKGFFKKKLSLKDILMDEMKYGISDRNFILTEGEKSEKEMIIFHPQHIARGMNVIWNEDETQEIQLHLLLSTTNEEIEDLYRLVTHLCHLWKTESFQQDGEFFTLNDIPVLMEKMKAYNYETLQSFLRDYETGTFFCAKWPIHFISEQVQNWIESPTLQNFARYLHTNQSQDLYYANARLYNTNDGKVTAAYTITATVDTIFPMKPTVPFAYINLQTGEETKVDEWKVGLVSLDKDDLIGMVDFQDFLNEIYRDVVHEFDSQYIYFDGLSKDRLFEISRKYSLK